MVFTKHTFHPPKLVSVTKYSTSFT